MGHKNISEQGFARGTQCRAAKDQIGAADDSREIAIGVGADGNVRRTINIRPAIQLRHKTVPAGLYFATTIFWQVLVPLTEKT